METLTTPPTQQLAGENLLELWMAFLQLIYGPGPSSVDTE